MALIPQHPLPWHCAGNREIGDGSGNVVQYTTEALGLICLAVNSHEKLFTALNKIAGCLHGDGSGDEAIRQIVREATGRVGYAALSAALEAAQAPSSALDAAIASELQRPQMAFTSSLDAAMTLVPPGWRIGFVSTVAELTSPDGSRTVKASNTSTSLAVCAASLMTMEE